MGYVNIGLIKNPTPRPDLTLKVRLAGRSYLSSSTRNVYPELSPRDFTVIVEVDQERKSFRFKVSKSGIIKVSDGNFSIGSHISKMILGWRPKNEGVLPTHAYFHVKMGTDGYYYPEFAYYEKKGK